MNQHQRSEMKKLDTGLVKVLTKDQEKRFLVLEKICVEGRAVFMIVGMALAEIKEHKFHEARGFEDFTKYCESIGYTRRYCNQMIISAEAVKDLPPELRKLVQSERAARAISALPSSLRVKIAVRASEDGTKAITSGAVKKLSPAPTRAKARLSPVRNAGGEKRPIPKREPAKVKEMSDKTGMVIPAEIRDDWQEAHLLGNEMEISLSHVRQQVLAGRDEQGAIAIKAMSELAFDSTLAQLSQAKMDVRRIFPHAVCPTCQGVAREDCIMCGGRGFISEFYWTKIVTKEVREMREKSIKEKNK